MAGQEGFCSQVHGQGIILQKIVSFSFFVKVPKEQAFRNTSPRIVYVTALQVICLKSGCDVKYIQVLLGHRDPKSTEVYLHVSNKTLLGIRSPFDEMGGE